MHKDTDARSSGLVIRRESGLPVYLQLVDQLRYLIGAGRYGVGDYLPPLRELADELGVNLNTINRAYRQLQRDGLIRSTPGKGARVVRVALEVPSETSALRPRHGVSGDQVDAILAAALERAFALGLSPKILAERVQALLADFAGRIPPPPAVRIWAGSPERSRLLAGVLSAQAGSDVPALNLDVELDAPVDVLVRPRFGAWVPDAPEISLNAFRLDLPVAVDRATVQAVLGITPGSVLVAAAADEPVARWLLDTLAGFVAPKSTRLVVAHSLDGQRVSSGEWLIVEEGIADGAKPAEGSGGVIRASFGFSPSAAEELARAVDEARAAKRAGSAEPAPIGT